MLHRLLNLVLKLRLKFRCIYCIPMVILFLFLTILKYSKNIHPKFIKPEITKNLNCKTFFNQNDTVRNMTFSKYAQQRITWKTPNDLPMNCSDIYARHYFSPVPLSHDEAMFPIAYVKNVYTDYYIMEKELATTFAPQNFYCFSIDSKATDIFRKQIHALSSCFPNVFFANKEFPLDSAGRYNSYAQFECLKLLIQYDWKYVILLLSHDIAIKTNAEIVQIMKWFDGTSDVMMINNKTECINMNYNWTFEELKIFRDDSLNYLTENGKPQQLKFAKGMTEASLSRDTVDYLFTKLDLTKTLSQFNSEIYYAPDENLLPTLLTTEALNIPGSFFHRCIDEIGGNGFFTRKSSWSTDHAPCQSGIWRHLLCIYGVEDLISLENTPHLFANKMLPESDFGAYICWTERMFNRTYGIGIEKKVPKETLNANTYLNHPAVRYNRMKKMPGFDSETFECTMYPINSSNIIPSERLA